MAAKPHPKRTLAGRKRASATQACKAHVLGATCSPALSLSTLQDRALSQRVSRDVTGRGLLRCGTELFYVHLSAHRCITPDVMASFFSAVSRSIILSQLLGVSCR